MRGLGAISVPPRPSDQPPFATIPVSGCALHRLCVEDICMCSSATHDVLLQTRPLNFARFFFNCLAGVSDPARAHNAECACLHASLHRPQQDSVGECGSSSCPCARVEKNVLAKAQRVTRWEDTLASFTQRALQQASWQYAAAGRTHAEWRRLRDDCVRHCMT